MNKIVPLGLGAAAVVVALVVGAQLFGSSEGGVGGQPAPTATPEPTPSRRPSRPRSRHPRLVSPRVRT